MVESLYWITFLSAAVALNIAPGPDLVFIISRTLENGWPVGVACSLGVCTGAMVHVGAAALGVSTVLMSSAIAFTVLKYAGAAYLIYIGIRILRAPVLRPDDGEFQVTACTPAAAFRQGVLIDVLNPKVALFFLAFLPQFVRPEIGTVPLQLAVLGSLVVVVAVVIELAVVLAATHIARVLTRHARIGVWINRLLESVLIGLGARVALSAR